MWKILKRGGNILKQIQEAPRELNCCTGKKHEILTFFFVFIASHCDCLFFKTYVTNIFFTFCSPFSMPDFKKISENAKTGDSMLVEVFTLTISLFYLAYQLSS